MYLTISILFRHISFVSSFAYALWLLCFAYFMYDTCMLHFILRVLQMVCKSTHKRQMAIVCPVFLWFSALLDRRFQVWLSDLHVSNFVWPSSDICLQGWSCALRHKQVLRAYTQQHSKLTDRFLILHAQSVMMFVTGWNTSHLVTNLKNQDESQFIIWQMKVIHSDDTHHFMFLEDLKTMKWIITRGQNSLQQVKHAKLYSDLLLDKKRKHLTVLDPVQRGP